VVAGLGRPEPRPGDDPRDQGVSTSRPDPCIIRHGR
jgi:hypothetical protein